VRSVGAGRWSATIAAAIYQASPLLMAHTFEGHYPHVWAACWYPWAFWAFRDQRFSRLRGRLLLPVILTLTFLTGHPQEWLLLVLALSAWSAHDFWVAWRAREARQGVAQAVGWVVSLSLSIGLAAVELAPELAVKPWLARNADAPAGLEIPRRYHVWVLNAWQLLSPRALGGPTDYFGDDNYWETLLSTGLAPLVLAVVAALRHPDRKLVGGWLVLAAAAIWFSCGRHLGLYALAYLLVPGMSWFRVPARALFLANLAGVVLAGLGVETLRTRMADAHAWRKLGVRFSAIALALLTGLCLIRYAHAGDDSSRTAAASARVLGDACLRLTLAAITAVILMGSLARGPRTSRLAGGLLGLAAVCELGWYGFALLQVAPVERFSGCDRLAAALVSLETDSPGGGRLRIKARDSFCTDLQAAALGIAKTNVNDVFQLEHGTALYETLYPVAARQRRRWDLPMRDAVEDYKREIRQAVFDRTSVGYLVSDRFESDPGWPVAAQGSSSGSHWIIQRNPSALPRAYVVPAADVVADEQPFPAAQFRGVDPREKVLMSVDPLRQLPGGPRQAFTAAAWSSLDPDHPVLEVTTQAPGLLVITDTWMPGWTARVDGAITPIYRGNVAQRVIPVWNAGRHTITLDYDPPGFALGLQVTACSVVVWGLMGVFWRASRRATALTRPHRPSRRRPPALHRFDDNERQGPPWRQAATPSARGVGSRRDHTS
jgi:hypothetical protein